MTNLPAPAASRVDRKKEETRQKIITVAFELFKQQGLDATTMEQIAAEVDIAKGTLYNYFPVKEAILDEYMRRIFRERNPGRVQQMQNLPDTRSRMDYVINELVTGVQAQKEIFERYMIYRTQKMISFHLEDSEKSGLYLVIDAILRLGQESGELRQDLPLLYLEDLFEFVFIEVVKQFYWDPEKYDARQVIEQGIDLFLHGAQKQV